MQRTMSVKKLVISAVMLALCMVLPFLTGQIPQFGLMFLPMHLPVLLCGFLSGPLAATLIGFIAPLLRFVLFGAPPLVPTGICMCIELAAYGFFSGFFYEKMKKFKNGHVVSLLLSMVLGRICWAVTSAVVYPLLAGKTFTFAIFIAGAFVDAWPGILLQLIIIPILVKILEKTAVLK